MVGPDTGVERVEAARHALQLAVFVAERTVVAVAGHGGGLVAVVGHPDARPVLRGEERSDSIAVRADKLARQQAIERLHVRHRRLEGSAFRGPGFQQRERVVGAERLTQAQPLIRGRVVAQHLSQVRRRHGSEAAAVPLRVVIEGGIKVSRSEEADGARRPPAGQPSSLREKHGQRTQYSSSRSDVYLTGHQSAAFWHCGADARDRRRGRRGHGARRRHFTQRGNNPLFWPLVARQLLQ
mmetsp:Transcript_22335/g.68561  ORF Transcript_22335/g.68561 Transcript_22335/m.68561 type:complete len:239 (-) Transcript_22335:1432-2148(-)